ncbi:MAG TPA: DUF885 domain-containing protein, partial [Duganella sp.]
MIKTKIALAVVMAAFAFAPAGAAAPKKAAGASTKNNKSTKSTKSTNSNKGGGKGKAAVAAGAATAAAATVVAAKPAVAPVSERRQDRSFDTLSNQFLNALWRIDSESAIYAGKYDTAATLSIPDPATLTKELAFIDDWKLRFGKVNAAQLSPKQRTDLTLLMNKLDGDRFRLTTLREHEWNPASYNVAGPLDLILTTEYAAQPQRLRTLLKRIASIPAYYQAARNNIVNPTREHTRLAIKQAPGVQSVLIAVDKAAQASILTPLEKQQFTQRVNAALMAVDHYVVFLTEMDKLMDTRGRRTFRIGKDMYEKKFAFDIQSGSTAEQTYQKALAAREELLTNMERLSDEMWDKYLPGVGKPADRYAKIGMMIDKLSANHVRREDFVNEIKRQIPVLQDWVVSKNLLTLDRNKPLEVRATPAYQAGVAGASIDAPGPYRPQDRTYYNVTPLDGATAEAAESSLREYNHWILQILNIHEAIPGHYAQLVYANKSPSIVKSIFGNGAMIEGWAVYGERMMLESGYGDNAPEMWLMYSKWNLRSVTNTILDYSVHVLGMTQDQAVDMLT